MSRPRIIDIRNRPSSWHDFYGATPDSPGWYTARWLNRRVGSREDRHFERSYTREGYLAEIDAAGIHHAVLIGRDTPGVATSNDAVHDWLRGDPRLIGIGSVDPQARDSADQVVAEVERVASLGLKGLNLEPAFGALPLAFDDPLLEPAYETAQRLKLPVFLMSGPTTPDLAYNDPSAVGRVARRYPDLPLVISHGLWPCVDEAIGVAFRYGNVYLAPDMYAFTPGGERYLQALDGFLGEQFLFGTSFPFRPMKQTVEDFLSATRHLPERVRSAVLYDNAARLLGLPGIR